ncbi:AAA domain-containing protein [bacterium]|nr:AAA domain-containing protein [bacterium]
MSGGPPESADPSAIESIRLRLHEAAKLVDSRVYGQRALIENLILGLCCGGHVLLEGLPGLAKTTCVRLLAEALGLPFGRVQMTPDVMPGDVLGSAFLKPDLSGFVFRPGPIFSTVLLVDELNRAPAKVQSALLEAMQEEQVTVGGETHKLPAGFWLVATQNPIDQEGTYPLAESQKDRFLLRLTVGYPDERAEAELLRNPVEPLANPLPSLGMSANEVLSVRHLVARVHCADVLTDWVAKVILATRDPSRVGLPDKVLWGVSPRGARMWIRAARTRAWWHGRDYVVPEDLHDLAHEALSHRIVLDWAVRDSIAGTRSAPLVERVLEKVGSP